MLRIAVCDDNNMFLQKLNQLLSDVFTRLKRPVEIELFCDPLVLLGQVEGRRDMHGIALLDLEMPKMHGFNVAQRLRKVDSSFKLIFLTSHTEDVFDAFRYNAFAFIPKAEMERRLESVLLDAVTELDADLLRDTRTFTVYQANRAAGEKASSTARIRDAELMYFESVKREIVLHTSKAVYTAKGEAFEALKEEYSRRGFLETHRTVMVNPAFLKLARENEAELTNGECVALSRRSRERVLKQLARSVRRSKQDDISLV